MRWRDGRQSDNVEDRRGMSIPRGVKIGGAGGLGILAIVLVGMFFGIDPSILLDSMPGVETPSVSVQQGGRGGVSDEASEFVAVVLADTEDAWKEAFGEMGRTYRPPTLVLFSEAVESACGIAGSAVGPFYCPSDQKVYLDLSFFEDLRARFGAPGDFAQAYVIAHEIGHHVQNLLGISGKVHTMQQGADKATANNLSVRLELQADCLAGIWAYHADRSRNIVESGDIEAALRAASSIGDDRIQKQSQGYVVPESFTHGSSEQRVRWFKRGIETGDFAQCDTFKTGSL